jgi:hypothetical protein
MARKPKLPTGFGKTLKGLIAQGYSPKDAMREAWKLHKASGPGMKKGKLYNPETKKQKIARYKKLAKHYRERQWEAMQAGNKKEAEAIRRELKNLEAYLNKLSENRNPVTHRTALKYARALVKHEREGVKRKNPIAIYNPNPRGVLIYGEVTELRAVKTSGPHKGQGFRHPFSSRVAAIGLTNGDVLLRGSNGQRLWDYDENI